MSLTKLIPFSDSVRTTVFWYRKYGFSNQSFDQLRKLVNQKLKYTDADQVYLDATIKWIYRGHDATSKKGVSNVFFINSGWGEAYPETSGYIISTLLNYHDHSGDKEALSRAKEIADWELSILRSDGAVFSSTKSHEVRVFNTGQVILGLCHIFEYTKDEKYILGAIKASNYLIQNQEYDGSWEKDTHCGARTYHARVAWGLARTYSLCGEEKFLLSAEKNISWVLKQKLNNGFFKNCGFNTDNPITHVIAYTLRGLWEYGMLCNDRNLKKEIFDTVIQSVENILDSSKNYYVKGVPGMLPASFNNKWVPYVKSSCLTGNAQIAILLYKIFQETNSENFKTHADLIVDANKSTQFLDSSYYDINGGIAGSFPFKKDYVRNGFPNWAAKFHADSLLIKINQKNSSKIRA